MRAFIGIDLSVESVPDAITLFKFQHLLEAHKLTRRILEEVKGHLAERRLLLKEGTIVDATIISAPSSTKNQKGERDPEMHQTKKGNQWYFGMKAHIGVDTSSGLVHRVKCTSANVADVTQPHALLHGEESMSSPMPDTSERRSARGPCPNRKEPNGTWRQSEAQSKPWPKEPTRQQCKPLRSQKPKSERWLNTPSTSLRISSVIERRDTEDLRLKKRFQPLISS